MVTEVRRLNRSLVRLDIRISIISQFYPRKSSLYSWSHCGRNSRRHSTSQWHSKGLPSKSSLMIKRRCHFKCSFYLCCNYYSIILGTIKKMILHEYEWDWNESMETIWSNPIAKGQVFNNIIQFEFRGTWNIIYTTCT